MIDAPKSRDLACRLLAWEADACESSEAMKPVALRVYEKLRTRLSALAGVAGVKGGIKGNHCGGVKRNQLKRYGWVVFGGEGALERSERGLSPPKPHLDGAGLAVCGRISFSAALLEPVTVAVHLEDVDVMGDAIK